MARNGDRMMEAILSREQDVREASRQTEYRWWFGGATLLAWVADSPGQPPRHYEYRFEWGPGDDGIASVSDRQPLDHGLDEDRVRDFVEGLLVQAGEDAGLLMPA